MYLNFCLADCKQAAMTVSLGLAFPILLTATSVAIAEQPILIDDFNDGNDDGWVHIDGDIANHPLGPANFDASSGEYRISSAGQIDDLEAARRSPGFGVIWATSSSDPLYSHGFLRAKTRIDESATHLGLGMRANEVGDGNFSFYSFGPTSISPAPMGSEGVFVFNKIVDGEVTKNEIVQFDAPLLGEEWFIEAGAVGDRLSMKFWPVGEPEPHAPQWEWIDPDPLPNGAFGAEFFVDATGIQATGTPGPWRIGATFDDVYFTPIPEPSAIALASLGVPALFIIRRRNGTR